MNSVTCSILVKPGSSREGLTQSESGELIIRIPAKAIDGAANAYLVDFLARAFDLRKNEVVIEKGHTSRHKRVRFYMSQDELEAKVKAITGRLPLK